MYILAFYPQRVCLYVNCKLTWTAVHVTDILPPSSMWLFSGDIVTAEGDTFTSRYTRRLMGSWKIFSNEKIFTDEKFSLTLSALLVTLHSSIWPRFLLPSTTSTSLLALPLAFSCSTRQSQAPDICSGGVTHANNCQNLVSTSIPSRNCSTTLLWALVCHHWLRTCRQWNYNWLFLKEDYGPCPTNH